MSNSGSVYRGSDDFFLLFFGWGGGVHFWVPGESTVSLHGAGANQ
jgi:hypothetical protein